MIKYKKGYFKSAIIYWKFIIIYQDLYKCICHLHISVNTSTNLKIQVLSSHFKMRKLELRKFKRLTALVMEKLEFGLKSMFLFYMVMY